MAERRVESDVDPGLAADAVAGDGERLERLDQRLLETKDVFLDVDAETAQIDERVADDLARAVVGDLAAAVAADDGDRAGVDDVLVATGDALREDRRVLADPEFVFRGVGFEILN